MPAVEVKKCGSGDSYLIENFFDPDGSYANDILKSIDTNITYLDRNDPRMQFHIYGKTMSLPRDKSVDKYKQERVELFYRYAKDTPPVEDWKDTILKDVSSEIELNLGQDCNHVVVNQYRDGNDYIGFHHDKSQTFVEISSVLTLSLGEERILRLKKVRGLRRGEIKDIRLRHGSMFVLGPKTNKYWKHSIVQRKGVRGRRVSLTFRSIAAERRSLLL